MGQTCFAYPKVDSDPSWKRLGWTRDHKIHAIYWLYCVPHWNIANPYTITHWVSLVSVYFCLYPEIVQICYAADWAKYSSRSPSAHDAIPFLSSDLKNGTSSSPHMLCVRWVRFLEVGISMNRGMYIIHIPSWHCNMWWGRKRSSAHIGSWRDRSRRCWSAGGSIFDVWMVD